MQDRVTNARRNVFEGWYTPFRGFFLPSASTLNTEGAFRTSLGIGFVRFVIIATIDYKG